jgi:hypothetical protein
MPLVALSIKLARVDESLLYQDPGGNFWLSAVCTLDEDQKGRLIVAQSIPKDRYAAGERGPAVGTWREIGGGNHVASKKPAFDLSKFKKPPAPNQPPPATGGKSAADDPLFPPDDP